MVAASQTRCPVCAFDAATYPALAQSFQRDGIRLQFVPDRLGQDVPVETVHAVTMAGDWQALVRPMARDWELAGGRLNDGETISDALRRELREELGARLETFRLLGTWRCEAAEGRSFAIALAVANVVIDGSPTVDGGEPIAEVALLSPDDAQDRLSAAGWPQYADLSRWASAREACSAC